MTRINYFQASVEAALARKGWRMTDLARAMGVTSPTLWNILNTGRPRESTILRIAAALDVHPDDLVKPLSPEEYGIATIPRFN